MLSPILTYASHQLDNYILHAVADENEVTLSFPTGGPEKPALRLTRADAYALRSLLNLPDGGEVVDAAAEATQHRIKIVKNGSAEEERQRQQRVATS